jgi:hypothetical protein
MKESVSSAGVRGVHASGKVSAAMRWREAASPAVAKRIDAAIGRV